MNFRVFVYLNCLFLFVVLLQKWFAHFLLIRNNGEIIIIKHFSSQESTVSSTFFIRRFQGYRCKSGITIWAWRVTWNYAYSPFKSIFHVFSVVIKQIVLTVAWKLIERSLCTRHYCCVYVHWTLYMYILALYSTRC